MKKRRFDLRRGLRRELDLGVNAVLKMGGGNMHHTVKKPFENEEYGEGGITDAEMLQADQENQENAPEKTPANPPFIKPKVLMDATKLTPNDRILFAFGDCIMKGQTKLKTYSSAYRYLVTKLRSLGHKVVFYPEQFTSKRFPMTGTQMQFSGSNQVTNKLITIRFEYYTTLN